MLGNPMVDMEKVLITTYLKKLFKHMDMDELELIML